MNRLIAFLVVIFCVGCGNLQHLRADRRLPAPVGTWDTSPVFLLHSNLSAVQQAVVFGQLSALQNTLDCGTWAARNMTPEEETRQLIGTVMPGTIVVTSLPPTTLRHSTVETTYYKNTNVLAAAEVRLGKKNNPRMVTHQLAYALGLGENIYGDPNLLMSIGKHHEELRFSRNELLPEEKHALCATTR